MALNAAPRLSTTPTTLQGIHLAYTAVQSKRSEVEEIGRDIESMHEHDRGLESQTSLLKGQQQQNIAKVCGTYPNQRLRSTQI